MEERKIEYGASQTLAELEEDRSKTIMIIGNSHIDASGLIALCEKIADETGHIILPEQIELVEEDAFPTLHHVNELTRDMVRDIEAQCIELQKQMMCEAYDLEDRYEEKETPPKKLTFKKNKKVPRANYGFQGKGYSNKGKNFNMRRR